MGCCNKTPEGGTKDIGLLLKLTAAFGAAILLLVLLFG